MVNAQQQERPPIPSIKQTENGSKEEYFQNTVLRPVIKMKSDLLIAYISNYIQSKKIPFNELSLEKKIDYLDRAISQDLMLRSELRGLIIGNFALDEYHQYAEIHRDTNKRIINIIKARIIDHVSEGSESFMTQMISLLIM